MTSTIQPFDNEVYELVKSKLQKKREDMERIIEENPELASSVLKEILNKRIEKAKQQGWTIDNTWLSPPETHRAKLGHWAADYRSYVFTDTDDLRSKIITVPHWFWDNPL
jgi:CRISPR/Cas system-associated protein Csm6